MVEHINLKFFLFDRVSQVEPNLAMAQCRQSSYKTLSATFLTASAIWYLEDPQRTMVSILRRQRRVDIERWGEVRGVLVGTEGSSDADDGADMESEDADMDDNADNKESFLQDEVR